MRPVIIWNELVTNTISQGGGFKIINKSGVIKYNCKWKWNTIQMMVKDCEVMWSGQGMDGLVTEWRHWGRMYLGDSTALRIPLTEGPNIWSINIRINNCTGHINILYYNFSYINLRLILNYYATGSGGYSCINLNMV